MQPPSVFAAGTLLWLLPFILTPTKVSCNACPPSTFDHSVNSNGALEFPVFHRDHGCARQHLGLARSSEDMVPFPIDLRQDEVINSFLFLMPIMLGTPAVLNLVAIDTGGTLSFVQCQPCTLECHWQPWEIFDPSKSESFKTVGCKEESCLKVQEGLRLQSKACMEKEDSCLYSMTFGRESSYSVGKLARDRLHVGQDNKGFSFPGFLFGCSLDTEYHQYEAGVFGFADEPFSFFEQVWPQVKYRAFSYCFASDRKRTGYLSIGNYTRRANNATSSTPLFHPLSGRRRLPHYALILDKVAVNGIPLVTNPTEMVVDSGSRWTVLRSDAFDQLDTVIAKALQPLKYYPSPIRGEEFMCFENARMDEPFKNWSALPVVELSFDEGATLTLPPHNSFYFDSSWGLCTYFMRASAENGVQLLGNPMTRSTGITYDMENKQFVFRDGDC